MATWAVPEQEPESPAKLQGWDTSYMSYTDVCSHGIVPGHGFCRMIEGTRRIDWEPVQETTRNRYLGTTVGPHRAQYLVAKDKLFRATCPTDRVM